MSGTQRRLALAGAAASLVLIAWAVAWWWLGDFGDPPANATPPRAAGYFLFAAGLPAVFALGPFLWWGRDRFVAVLCWGGGLLLAYGTVTVLAGGFLWYVPGGAFMLAGSRRLAEWL